MTDAPACDRRLEGLEQERQLGARGVLRAELDVVVGTDHAPGLRDAGADPLEDVLAACVRSLCVMWMSLVAMKTCSWRLRAGSSAAAATVTSAGTHRASAAMAGALVRGSDFGRDAPDGLGLAGGGGREAGLDDVDAQPRQLLRDA